MMILSLKRSISTKLQRMRALNFIPRTIESFVLDLDLPASERWRIMPQSCRNAIRYASDDVWNTCIDREESLSKELLQATIDNVKRFTPLGYQEEMMAIAQEADVTFEDIIMFNFLHDYDPMACTSIIARKPNGKLVVGQNYDYEVFETGLHNLFEVEYKRRGKIIGKGLHAAAQIGPLYSYIDGRYLLQSSRAEHGSKGHESFTEMLGIYNSNKRLTPQNILIRENFIDAEIKSLDDMKDIANGLQYLVHQILLIGDEDNAYLLEKEYSKTSNEYQLGHDGRWFIVSANQDWAVRGGRQAAAESILDNLGKENFSSELMFRKILTKKPCFMYRVENNKMLYRTATSFFIEEGVMKTFNWN